MTLYAAPAAPRLGRPTDRRAPAARAGREFWSSTSGARQLDPVCARALSLRAGEIELPQTRAAYAKFGIERGRDAYGAFRDDQCVAVLLRETASPGLCLSGLMSASFLLPVLPDADLDGTRQLALCHLARAARAAGRSAQPVPVRPDRTPTTAPCCAAGLEADRRVHLLRAAPAGDPRIPALHRRQVRAPPGAAASTRRPPAGGRLMADAGSYRAQGGAAVGERDGAPAPAGGRHLDARAGGAARGRARARDSDCSISAAARAACSNGWRPSSAAPRSASISTTPFCARCGARRVARADGARLPFQRRRVRLRPR